MSTVALQNMFFASGLNEMSFSPNFATGKSAGPKAKLANSGEATTPDNIYAVEAQGPVETGNDFKYELASKVEKTADEAPVNQGDVPADRPNAEQVKAADGQEAAQVGNVVYNWQAQVQLAASGGGQESQQGAVSQQGYLVGEELIAVEGKVNDAVGKALEEMSANIQPDTAASEETTKALDSQGMVVDNKTQMPTDAAPDSIVVEVKAEPTTQSDTAETNATVQQQSAQELTGEPKPEGQVSVDQAIKESLGQDGGKEGENVQPDSKNVGPMMEGQVQNNSVSNNDINTALSDAEIGDQQANTGEADKESVKTTLQQEFGSNLNVQINNQAGADESITEQVMPLSDSVVVEPKTQAIETEQDNTNVLLNNVSERVGEQIQSAISASVSKGESEVTVQLNPPELGRVVIKLQQEEGQVTGLLEFSKAQTKLEVEQLLPQLVRGLQDAGIAVRKLDVIQTQIDNSNSSYEQFKEYVGHDNNGQQHQDLGSNQSYTGPLAYEWTGESVNYQATDWSGESVVSDEAVNVLV
ncbi:MAG: flagellar hook-length control protein FliK [Phycisphaerales bacterium]|jgi:flagellar hook-length control protein FliK